MNTKIDDAVVEVSGLIVLDSMMGHSVGRALLQSAISNALSERASHLVVQTERANTQAIDFYRSHGFHIQNVTIVILSDKLVELVKLASNLG
jgi:ribosomal protein S18 acetylase RimI-like enzyme